MAPRPFVDSDHKLGDRNLVAALLSSSGGTRKQGWRESEAASPQRGSKHHSNVASENPTDAQ